MKDNILNSFYDDNDISSNNQQSINNIKNKNSKFFDFIIKNKIAIFIASSVIVFSSFTFFNSLNNKKVSSSSANNTYKSDYYKAIETDYISASYRIPDSNDNIPAIESFNVSEQAKPSHSQYSPPSNSSSSSTPSVKPSVKTEYSSASSSPQVNSERNEVLISAINSKNVISGTKLITSSSGPFNNYDIQNNQIPSNSQNQQGSSNNANEQTSDMLYNNDMQSYSIFPGTVIQVVLLNSINSDLPGIIIARVTKTVYDSKTGNNIIIPQGSIFIASYSTDVTFAQDRLQIAWRRLVRPDGVIVDVEGFGSDKYGMSGIPAKVNRHILLKTFGIGFTFVYAVSTAIVKGASNELSQAGSEVVNSTAQPILNTSNQMINKNLSIPNTLTVKQGTLCTVLIYDTLVLPPYNKF